MTKRQEGARGGGRVRGKQTERDRGKMETEKERVREKECERKVGERGR